MNCLKGREKSTVNNNLVDSLKRIRPNLFIRRLENWQRKNDTNHERENEGEKKFAYNSAAVRIRFA
ncbi:hypothetical protein T01_1079, partial [Trichinella spiralis]